MGLGKNAKNLTSQRFGRLLAIEPTGERDKHRNVLWRFVCDCGNTKVLPASQIKYQQSCGCLQREAASRIAVSRTKHRMCDTSEYQSYSAAKKRCNNPNDVGYANYGGRGIEFRYSSFEQFYAELGEKPEPKHLYSVERIDNHGHYEPGNVRWATDKEQANNRRFMSRPRCDGTSGFLGVTFDKSRNKFQSHTVKGKLRTLGRFNTAEEAHKAYLAARKEAGR